MLIKYIEDFFKSKRNSLDTVINKNQILYIQILSGDRELKLLVKIFIKEAKANMVLSLVEEFSNHIKSDASIIYPNVKVDHDNMNLKELLLKILITKFKKLSAHKAFATLEKNILYFFAFFKEKYKINIQKYLDEKDDILKDVLKEPVRGGNEYENIPDEEEDEEETEKGYI